MISSENRFALSRSCLWRTVHRLPSRYSARIPYFPGQVFRQDLQRI